VSLEYMVISKNFKQEKSTMSLCILFPRRIINTL